jgi:class 3 adenylate cyclase
MQDRACCPAVYADRVEADNDPVAGDLARLSAAGLYDPDSPIAGQRLELLRYLLERFTVDEIEYWAEVTSIWGVAARAIDRPPPMVSARHLAARMGVDIDVVSDLRGALGFPVFDPEAPTIPESFADDLGTFLLGTELFGREEALALARVIGWAAARVAEAARAAFGNSIVGMDPSTRTELEMAKANEAGAAAWIKAQSVITRAMAEHPLRNASFVEALMAGELRIALAFVDLVSSTTWAASLAPADLSEALRRFEMRASTIAVERGARLVKLIGDEAMLVAEDPASLCHAAIAICDMARADPALPPARGAVGFGYVTARDGDYFGPLVNVVSRAVKLADPGSIVATSDTVRTLDPALWSVVALGPNELRGIGGDIHLSQVALRPPNHLSPPQPPPR